MIGRSRSVSKVWSFCSVRLWCSCREWVVCMVPVLVDTSCEVSASLIDVGGVAVGAIDLVNCSCLFLGSSLSLFDWTQTSDEENRTEHHRLTNHTVDWDSVQRSTYSTNYCQRLILESWFTNLEWTPLNRCQPDGQTTLLRVTQGIKPFIVYQPLLHTFFLVPTV